MDAGTLQELFKTEDLWDLAKACINNDELPPVELVKNLTSPSDPEGWHLEVLDALLESSTRANYRAVEGKKKLQAMRKRLLTKIEARSK